MGLESNNLKAKMQQMIRLKFHHGGGDLLSGVETEQDTAAVAITAAVQFFSRVKIIKTVFSLNFENPERAGME